MGAGSTLHRHNAGFGASATWSPPEKRVKFEEEGGKTPLHANESLEK
jgi:hypothetical protein